MRRDRKRLEELSHQQGGAGVALRNAGPLTQLGIALPIGQTPGPGTGCTVYLGTGNDTAYDNAIVSFVVKQYGHAVIVDTQTISPAENAAQPTLTKTSYGVAADFWEVYLELTGATLPAVPLQSSAVCFGVEDGKPGGGGGTYTGAAPIVVTGTVISIDPAYTPWIQVGGVGGIIEAIDATASVEWAGGSTAGGTEATAGSGGAAGGLQAVAFGLGSLASADQTFAAAGGVCSVVDAVALGQQSIANGVASLALAGGTANGDGGVAIGSFITETNAFGIVLGQQAGTLVSFGDDPANANVSVVAPGSFGVSSLELGFFGVFPATQQIGGAATAGAVYTGVEQGMLNALYTMAQAYGLLT